MLYLCVNLIYKPFVTEKIMKKLVVSLMIIGACAISGTVVAQNCEKKCDKAKTENCDKKKDCTKDKKACDKQEKKACSKEKK